MNFGDNKKSWNGLGVYQNHCGQGNVGVIKRKKCVDDNRIIKHGSLNCKII